MDLSGSMDLFVNKLRKTVSDVAYQVNSSVSTLIPGNLIHREYQTLKLRCNHGCPGLVWNVYDAVKRDSSSIKASIKDAIGPTVPLASQITTPNQQDQVNDEKQMYSVFVFDKSQLDSLPNKSEKEAALDHIKKGVTQLIRLKHPAILTVHHSLEESRSTLAFVTEHVFGHLESILKEQRGKRISSQDQKVQQRDLVDLSQDLGPKDSEHTNESCQLDEVQIKAGLLQLCDGLLFLHNDAKMLHRNICLDNIFVDSNNSWKIGGFDFSVHQPITETQSAPKPDAVLQIVEFGQTSSGAPAFQSLKALSSILPSSVVPNWSCSAPEHSSADHVTYSADVYSLGILSCALLGKDTDMIDLSYEYGLISDTYKRGIRFRELADRLPASFKSSIMAYAAINANSRPPLEKYQSLPIFNDPHVRAIRDLDARYTWDRLKKIDYFNQLREILPRLSHQVKINRVAKSLFNEVMNTDILPYVLPCLLLIAKDSTPSEFKTKIFPNLKYPFRVLEPKTVPLLLLDNIAVLADRAKLCLAEFQQLAFTLIQYLLRMDLQLQEKSLMTLPQVKKYIDNESMTKLLLPELNRLCHETDNLSIRVKCLDCIDKLIDTTDKSIVHQQILPIVFNIPSREPGVVMAATSIIKTIVNDLRLDLTKENIAEKILPFLIPLIIVKDLNLQQFETIMSLIKNLTDRVEREQRSYVSKRNPDMSHKSNPLVLNNFKGSNHFQILD